MRYHAASAAFSSLTGHRAPPAGKVGIRTSNPTVTGPNPMSHRAGLSWCWTPTMEDLRAGRSLCPLLCGRLAVGRRVGGQRRALPGRGRTGGGATGVGGQRGRGPAARCGRSTGSGDGGGRGHQVWEVLAGRAAALAGGHLSSLFTGMGGGVIDVAVLVPQSRL